MAKVKNPDEPVEKGEVSRDQANDWQHRDSVRNSEGDAGRDKRGMKAAGRVGLLALQSHIRNL